MKESMQLLSYEESKEVTGGLMEESVKSILQSLLRPFTLWV